MTAPAPNEVRVASEPSPKEVQHMVTRHEERAVVRRGPHCIEVVYFDKRRGRGGYRWVEGWEVVLDGRPLVPLMPKAVALATAERLNAEEPK